MNADRALNKNQGSEAEDINPDRSKAIKPKVKGGTNESLREKISTPRPVTSNDVSSGRYVPMKGVKPVKKRSIPKIPLVELTLKKMANVKARMSKGV